MKKIFLIVLAVIILLATAIFFLIPTKAEIAGEVTIDASDVVAAKFLITQTGWDKWWPGKKLSDKHYQFDGADFYISKVTNSDVYLALKKDGQVFNSDISYLAGEEGSVNVKWIATGEDKSGFFSRLNYYFGTKAATEQIAVILNSLKHFLQDERNVYGYRIYLNHAKDTVLLATSGTYPDKPSLPMIYGIINNLKEQAKKQGAAQTNFPMLNVTQTDDHTYALNVALPINITISPAPNTTITHIPKGGNLLVADVHGGPNTADNALNQVKAYMKDHRLVSPAMPFQSLITDRSAEKDTSKWVTKIYYPIL
ncbi:hypothetical protein [Mucilaginibacter celer]|uniref:Uncharacterized protein n=1 Tax=Mucilaginibacter celer TaxID=2305508 RepID=A0A494VPB8_9SPHI|nr:hypothetical protein [Mucilaginibacter celer]AYL95671.1 hypothetical protein HYN43_010395 [Mucilaginibacter celer]